MKRLTAVLLAVILLISLVPLSANAATKDTAETAASTERKFQLLLEDLELVENVHQSDRYFYEEIGQYPAKNPEWVLIRGGLIDLSAKNNIQYQYATIGNKLLRANVNSSPFKLGYGIYDFKSGVFYDILDAWDMNLNNLRDVWDNLAPAEKYSEKDKSAENAMYTIGDADADGKVTILDATRIQRIIAELDENPWEKFAETGSEFIRGVDIAGATDYDRDGKTTVMDATRIQRGIAELPSILDYKVKWNESEYTPDDLKYREKYIVTDRSQLHEEYPDEKRMLDTYDDSFFTDQMLVGVNILGHMEQYMTTVTGVSIDSDGVLNVDFRSERKIEAITITCHQTACIELSKAFLDDIKDIKINVEYVTPVSQTLVADAVKYIDAIDRPSNAVAAQLGYKMLSTTHEFTGSYDLSVPDSFKEIIELHAGQYNSSELKGYLAVIKTPEQYKYIFPKRDASKYTEAFFKDHALIALVHQFSDYYDYMTMSHVAVKRDTLYAEIDVFTPFDNAPLGNVYYDVVSVSLDDVKDVNNARLWYDDRYSRNWLLNVYSGDSELPALPYSIDSANVQRISATSVYRDTDSDLYLPESMYSNPCKAKVAVAYNPEQMKYLIGYQVPDGDESFEDNAYLILDYLSKDKTAGIAKIYFNASAELDVILSESEVSESADYRHTVQIMKIPKDPIFCAANNIYLWSETPIDSTIITGEITPMEERPANIAYWGSYPQVYPTQLTQNVPGKYDYTWEDLEQNAGVKESETGYSFLIDSKEKFKKLLPKTDSSVYTDSFFRNYSLIVTVMQGYDDSAYADVNYVMKDVDDVLYINPQVKYTQSTDEDGTPVAEPTEPLVWCVQRVSRKSVAGVKSIGFWRNNPTSGKIAYSVMEAYDPDYVFSEDTAADHITAKSLVNSAINTLYGNEDRDSHTFEVEKKDDKYFETHDVIAMRVYQGSCVVTLEVTGVELKNNQLIVSIDRHHPNLIQPPDSHIQLVFLEIPTLGARYNNIKVNFNDILDNNGLIAELTPTAKRNDESYIISHASDYNYITTEEMEAVDGSNNLMLDYANFYLEAPAADGYIMLLRNKAEFDQHFRNIKTRFSYSDAFFEDTAVIAVLGRGSDSDATAKLTSLAVTDEGRMLYTDARIDYPHPDLGAVANEPFVWTLHWVSQSDVENVSDIGLWNSDSMIREIVPERPTMNTITRAWGDQCKLLSTDAYQITALSGTQQRYGNWTVFRLNETLSESGYVMVIKDKRTFERFFPATDFRQSYDGFFTNNAMIVMVSRGSDDNTVAEMSDFAVVGQSLYVDAHTSTSYLGEPSRPMIWTCVSVKKSDLDGVKEIRFWDSDSMIREIKPTNLTMDFIKTSNEDRYRALDSTAIDIEPKSDMARYHLSYSSHNLPGSMYVKGYIMMIKDKTTLDRHFPADLFDTEDYTDAYFKDNAIIAMVSKGGEDTARAELKAPAIIGEQLYIDADVSYHPYFSSDGMEAEQPSSPTVWAFRQVKKSDISGVKSFGFWNSEAIVEPIYFRNYHIPDPTSENVKDIKTTAITMSAPSESDFSWKPLGSSDNDYVLILSSRTALEYYLPGFDKEKQYNDTFFKDNAIIAAVLKGNDHTSAAQFGKIGIIHNTLFVNAYYTNNYPVDVNGTPVAQPTEPTIWAFRKVSKEDIGNVGNIQFWNAPAED